MSRSRDCILALVLACLAATAGRAQEAYPTQGYPTQGYPTHVVKIVVPSLPGSTTDILARLVANQLSNVWGNRR
jgi:tripartite-type tricarboxylate transporter receptor subunit TctC